MESLTKQTELKKIFDSYIDKWHKQEDLSYSSNDIFYSHAIEILLSNYKLWHLEDLARDIEASDKVIAGVKRKIDKENQLRNDKIEKLDLLIDSYLKEKSIKPLSEDFNSETPGSIIDRITILSLKIYHMNEQTQRTDVTEEHIDLCKNKLKILHKQRDDLLLALSKLAKDLLHGRKKHKVYFQFKMYNDPNLNPVLYKK